jgi:hypothetical protein
MSCVVCHKKTPPPKGAVCPQCAQTTCIECVSRLEGTRLCPGSCTMFHARCPHCRSQVDVDYARAAVSKTQFARVAVATVRDKCAALADVTAELEVAMDERDAAIDERDDAKLDAAEQEDATWASYFWKLVW